MASSGNFCTLNPLAQQGGSTAASTRAGSMSNGNVKYVNLTGNTALGTFGVTSGKWYFEVYINSFNADNGMTIGWANDLFNLDAELGYNSPSSPSGAQAFGWYAETNKLMYGPGDGGSSYNKTWGGGTKVTDGDIVGIYLDADNGKFWASKNGTVFNSGDPSAGTGHGFGTGGSPHDIAISSRTLYPAIGNWSGADATVTFNFGQDSSFQGAVSAGGNADGNGFGDFKYDPDGFLALCSANLSISDDIDPAQTDDDYIGGKHFGAVEYTGNANTGQSISGMGFKPDLLWCKMTSSSQNNQLYDSSRLNTRSPTPTPKGLRSDTTGAEFDDQSTGNNNPIIASFDSDGFTLGGSGSGPNDSGRTYIGMGWRANGGTTATNNDGNVTTTIQANPNAGFSIIKWTGTGTNSRTLGTGLTKQAEFVIVKRYNTTGSWFVYHHQAKDGGQPNDYGVLTLNTVNAYNEGSGALTYWDISEWSDSVFSVGGDSQINGSGDSMLAYAWHSVEGFSKFGHYYGTGNTDGTFVYLGFRPKFVIIKKASEASTTYGWPAFLDIVNDNVNDAYFNNWWVDQTVAASGNYPLDFLSNGFKHRNNNTNLDGSGKGYIYAAWGSVPSRYNNTF